MTDSVHVLRIPVLPDNQEAAIALQRDGSVIVYMREDCITAAGATALQSTMDAARDAYHRAWSLPAVLAS